MLYGTGDKIYSTGYTAYGHTECSVTIRGNVSGSYVTTAFLSGTTPSYSSFSASSTGDFVTTVVPEGSTAFVTAKAPDYWSASNINTNAIDSEQWVSENNSHSRICSGKVLGHTYFTVESTAVGPRYFSAYMSVGAAILNQTGIDKNQFRTYVKEPFYVYSFTGDSAIVGTGCIREDSGINVKNGTTYRYSAYDSGPHIKPNTTFKNTYTIIADLGLYNVDPMYPNTYEGVPFYVIRSNSGASTYGTASVQYYFPNPQDGNWSNTSWYNDEIAIEFQRTASGSGTSEWTCTDTGYFGCAAWVGVDSPTQYSKVNLVAMGSSKYNTYYSADPWVDIYPTCNCVLFSAISK